MIYSIDQYTVFIVHIALNPLSYKYNFAPSKNAKVLILFYSIITHEMCDYAKNVQIYEYVLSS